MDMEMEKKLQDICEMQSIIMSCLKSQLDMGISDADTKEVGEVVDIIKDLAQAEKYHREAAYYKQVVDAMEDKSDARFGYSFTKPTRRISYSYKPMVDQEPYIDSYLNSEYGEPYTEYMSAKRHYTETGSKEDKTMMDKHAREHLDQTIETMSDIWDDATPELKQKIRSELKSFIDNI